MAKPGIVNIETTNTFQNWLDGTNELINLMKTDVMTASELGDSTTGNATLVGTFTANNVIVDEVLRFDFAESKTGINNPVTFNSPLFLDTSIANTSTFRSLLGPRSSYTNDTITWQIGFESSLSPNFVITTGSGAPRFRFNSAGNLSLSSLTTPSINSDLGLLIQSTNSAANFGNSTIISSSGTSTNATFSMTGATLNSNANGFTSAVIASQTSTAGGIASFVIGSLGSSAIGELSSIISSSNSNTSSSRTTIITSDSSQIQATKALSAIISSTNTNVNSSGAFVAASTNATTSGNDFASMISSSGSTVNGNLSSISASLASQIQATKVASSIIASSNANVNSSGSLIAASSGSVTNGSDFASAISSSNSTANGNLSSVIAASTSQTTGTNSGIFASVGATASGNLSSIISSLNSQATAINSGVIYSQGSVTNGPASLIAASLNSQINEQQSFAAASLVANIGSRNTAILASINANTSGDGFSLVAASQNVSNGGDLSLIIGGNGSQIGDNGFASSVISSLRGFVDNNYSTSISSVDANINGLLSGSYSSENATISGNVSASVASLNTSLTAINSGSYSSQGATISGGASASFASLNANISGTNNGSYSSQNITISASGASASIASTNSTIAGGGISLIAASSDVTSNGVNNAIIASSNVDFSVFARQSAIIASGRGQSEDEVPGPNSVNEGIASTIMSSLSSSIDNVSSTSSIISSANCELISNPKISTNFSFEVYQRNTIISSIDCGIIGFGTGVTGNNAQQSSMILSSRNTLARRIHTVTLGFANTGPRSEANRTIEIRPIGGNITAVGGFTTGSPADFAELFENKTGQKIEAGIILTQEEDGIRIAGEDDDISGVVSYSPAVLANDSPYHWHGRYEKDEFGNLIYENQKYAGWEGDPKDCPIISVPKESANWNPELEQSPRSERPDEWTPVALLGQVFVRVSQDVKDGDKIKPSNGGIGVPSSYRTGLKCMKVTTAYDEEKGYAVAKCLINVQV